MKITLLVVGKNKEQYVQQALNDYQKRINRYVPFRISEVTPVKSSRKYSIKEIQQKEAQSIRKALPDNARVVLLDEKGQQKPSETFARWMQKQMSSGIGHLIFVIGGAYGFPEDLRQEATGLISLSKMTMSHQVVRVMFAEQLYRAFTILHGEPYHHGG
ncbi:MAG TPA: 23S rRNA (pseudouridine(1915)-N(3))-methyltransferase RlmH [Bacteroidales bacterium]|nr:23S rRNA (pseudouridine(1915)-N(3))-methyltransferase RlmH [Bacteroidales bacterium]